MSRIMAFGPLAIEYDETVLRPRRWTVAQGRWAATLLPALPPGPVLELCAGAGQIGLLAVHGTRRTLVAVDASPTACAWARHNATSNGLRADVREASLGDALGPDESFPLVIADPPWVPHDDIGRHPDDPVTAIDGGPDGLDVARQCVDLAAAHLAPDGSVLLQLGTNEQADRLGPAWGRVGLTEHSRYVVPGRGVVVHLRAPRSA
ncbi:methyltransferase domain-containing protein [Pimelobacter simplex]|uniref:methyltransferase domain-containing protein n=1 Tax=Nocardioides simplex TaxID=2045 RepID=UPI003AADDDC2